MPKESGTYGWLDGIVAAWAWRLLAAFGIHGAARSNDDFMFF